MSLGARGTGGKIEPAGLNNRCREVTYFGSGGEGGCWGATEKYFDKESMHMRYFGQMRT